MRAARRPPDQQPQRPPSRAALLARGLLLALVVLAAISPAFSGDSEQRDADARQKLYVRRAFNEDAGLAAFAGDIWVEVKGTTVVLSGKLPSAMLRQRAIFLAGQVRGIGDVSGDALQVEAGDGVPDLPSPFPEGTPPRGTLAGNRHDGHTTGAPPKAEPVEPDSVRLLPPVPAGPTPAQPSGPIVEMLQPRPLPEPSDLSSAVEALRRKEDRYRQLRIEVRQKTVYLRGTVSRWDDATDLANAVRRLPGVEAVILDGVQVDRRGAR